MISPTGETGSEADSLRLSASSNIPSTKWRNAPYLGKAAALDLHRGIAFPVPMHKELHPLYSRPNKLTSPCPKLCQFLRFLHLTLTVIFSCGRLLIIALHRLDNRFSLFFHSFYKVIKVVCHTINKKCFFLSCINIHIQTTAFHFTI